MRYFLVLFICVLGIHSYSFTNENYAIQEIQITRDLPVSEVTDIFFGQKGLLWIGTNNGLYYFDGYNYSRHLSLYFDEKTLNDDRILDISQDSDGIIWLQTEYGLETISIIDKNPSQFLRISDSEEIHAILHDPELPYVYLAIDRVILQIEKDTRAIDTLYQLQSSLVGNLHIHHKNIWFVDGSDLVQYNLITHKSNGLSLSNNPAQRIKIRSLSQQELLISVDRILYRYNVNSSKLQVISTFSNIITDFAIYSEGKIAVSTVNSVYTLELNSNATSDIILITRIPDLSIRNILYDNNGLIWICTNKSIVKLNPWSSNFKYTPFLDGRINYPIDDFIVFESSHQGAVFRNSRNKFFYYNQVSDASYPLPDDTYTSVLQIDDKLLLGSESGIWIYNLDNRTSEKLVSDIYINVIKNIDEKVLIAADEGLFHYEYDSLTTICSTSVWDFLISNGGTYLVNENGFCYLDTKSCEVSVLLSDKSIKENSRINDILQSYDGKTWIATDNGLFQFIPNDELEINNQFKLIQEGMVYSLIEAPELPEVWFSSDVGIGAINYRSGRQMIYSFEDGVKSSSYLAKGALYNRGGEIAFITGKQEISFKPEDVFRNNSIPKVFILKAIMSGKDITHDFQYLMNDTLHVSPDIRYLQFQLTTLDFYSPRNVRFEYSLEYPGTDAIWKTVGTGNNLSIGGLMPGKYELQLRATNNHGISGESYRKLILVVKAPILQTKWAYFLYFISLIFMVALIIRIRTRTLRKINREYKDKERIAKKIEVQKEELTLKNKNITDSINYARRIQLAMMPSVKLFSSVFPDSFVLHMPKDIVSGDFYWVNQVKNRTFFSAVDCTGHGVPGAFMSIIGVELFRRITEIEGISTPAEVLNSLSRNFERVFGDVDEMKLRDGMDLAFCSLNDDFSILEFSGAFNPLYIVRDSSIMEIKGDRHSVGVYEEEDNLRSFNNHVIPLQGGDTVYIFTDGFADQFGGPEGKKYKYRRFRHLLLALHQLPMDKQREFLQKSILEWKGDLDQVDDILVMGIKIHRK